MFPALNKLSSKFAFLDSLSSTNKVGLVSFLFVLAAIPVTTAALIGYRTFSSHAATGQPTSLTPAYSLKNSLTPTFSWSCYCWTTSYRVYLRVGDGNFWSGNWYKDVGTSTSADWGGWKAYNLPAFSGFKYGTTYSWAVGCTPGSGSCTTSATQAFTILDTIPPTAPTITATNVTTSGFTLNWTASDSGSGVKSYSYCYYDYVDPKYYNDVIDGKIGGGDGTACSAPSSTKTITDSGLLDSTSYLWDVTAYDFSGNMSAKSTITVRTLKKDSDWDGFGDAAETHMGTVPTAACGYNAWPIDFNNDKSISSADRQILYTHTGTAWNQSTKNAYGYYYQKRYDLNLDGYINSTDQGIVDANLGKRC